MGLWEKFRLKIRQKIIEAAERAPPINQLEGIVKGIAMDNGRICLEVDSPSLATHFLSEPRYYADKVKEVLKGSGAMHIVQNQEDYLRLRSAFDSVLRRRSDDNVLRLNLGLGDPDKDIKVTFHGRQKKDDYKTFYFDAVEFNNGERYILCVPGAG